MHCLSLCGHNGPMAIKHTIHARIDPELVNEARAIYDQLGMTITQAIKVFLIKSVMEGGIPFDMTITEEKKE